MGFVFLTSGIAGTSGRLLLFAAVLFLPWTTGRAQTLGPNILPEGQFNDGQPTYVPWAGVDAMNNIHGIEGRQLSVGEDGRLAAYTYGPSVAVGDLRGKGVQDLVLGDTRGFFWFFPNSGTPQHPVFTQGDVMPIWLGEERLSEFTEGVDSLVPRIQLADLTGGKKLDIYAGLYSGKLYHILNEGSSTGPAFRPTYNRDLMLVNTHKKGVLWNNYMAPCLTSLFSGNLMDLICGEGTYSANSIYFLRNINSNAEPTFSEDRMTKIIPGLGMEQLTPVVLDWNGDGKADILTGDRQGYITLFLNTSSDPGNPTYGSGTHVKVGGVEKFGQSTTVAIADLTGNKLPNLLIGSNDGTILYATNTGTPGAPEFKTAATPLKGVLPPTYHHVSPRFWYKWQAYGAAYELLSYVNPQTQPGFSFPDGVKAANALKFWVWPYQSAYFPQRYLPKIEDEWRQHIISCPHKVTLKLNTHYRLHFWVKSDGNNVSDFKYRFKANNTDRDGFHPYDVNTPISCGTSWTEVNDDVEIKNPNDKTLTSWGYEIQFRWAGQTTFYLTDLQLQEKTGS